VSTEVKEEVLAHFLEYIRENSIECAVVGQIVASEDVIDDADYDASMQSFFTKNDEEYDSLYVYTYEYYPYVHETLDDFIADIVHGEIDVDEGLEEMQQFVDDKVEEGSLDIENEGADNGEE